ncbi:MAG: UvrD-helicase domain-containing protein [Dysgonamonadaceae bacterium]|jgi:DNA helicase-2/ATP-dependent DNA helicase PcrA|nr:UvrD-helicase domain-containing protein [Dysgonamonadaceae bacterium]
MDQFLQQLNDNQREAVLYNEGPSLVIAGAGSGKTRVLTYKVAYLLQSGISPYSILALTFTNKAAREMKSRIAQITNEDTARRLWMGTFHSIFSRILRREADRFGYRSDFTIYDAQDSKNLLKAIIKEKELDDKIYKPTVVQARISKAKNALITPFEYRRDPELITDDTHVKRGRLHEIYTDYWNRCKTSGVLDFDDLLLYTYLLFRDHPDVLERYQNQFRFILVDEYQDTNSVQHAIVCQLAADHHRVCVVGDDAQSIYSFRGANIGNILNFRKTYPESKLFKLEQNYRSTQTIVNAANSLIHKNKEQIHKTVFSKNSPGEQIQVMRAYSDYEEGFNVSSRIAEMRMLHQYDYKDFAILYRTNAQSRIFEEALRKLNIPYKIYGGLSFYQRKEVKDIIAYMRLIVNPNDEEAFKRVINYPARGIGSTTLNKIIAAANLQGVSLWEVMSNPIDYNLGITSGTVRKLAEFQTLIQEFIDNNATQSAYELGTEIVRKTGLMSELYADKTIEGLSRVQNVEELTNSLYGFVSSRLEEGNPAVKIGDFLFEIALLTDQDTDKDENLSRVTMMTVHSAKGLEFPNVFVVGLEEDLFPSERSKNSAKEIEEERRLFYVAITRAEENVILSYAKSRFQNGQSRMCTPSRFIQDIDSEYLHLPAEISIDSSERFDLETALKTQMRSSIPKPEIYLRGREDNSTRWRSGARWDWGKDQEEDTPQKPFFTNPLNLTQIRHRQTEEPRHERIGVLAVGTTIRHERFGLGHITELTGENENAKATVEFNNFGKKQLLLKFAKFDVIC